MKRPIAMLLALLLTAGLFAFVSCGDGKNYTVEEVEITETRTEKRIFLNDETIGEIENGECAVFLNGWSQADLHSLISTSGYGTRQTDEALLFKSVHFAAKCKLIEEEMLFLLLEDCCGVFPIWTVKIEKLFFSEGSEKEGDIIKISDFDYIQSVLTGKTELGYPKRLKERGLRLSAYSYQTTPSKSQDFYIIASRGPTDKMGYALNTYASYVLSHDFSIINEVGKGKYLYSSHTFGSLSEDAQIIEGIDRDDECDMILETDNMDELFGALIDEHKN